LFDGYVNIISDITWKCASSMMYWIRWVS